MNIKHLLNRGLVKGVADKDLLRICHKLQFYYTSLQNTFLLIELTFKCDRICLFCEGP